MRRSAGLANAVRAGKKTEMKRKLRKETEERRDKEENANVKLSLNLHSSFPAYLQFFLHTIITQHP